MEEKDKQLLLKDICARLPYYTELYSNVADDNWAILTPVIISNLMNADNDLVIKPYLRSMSSMTEEEAIKYITLTHYNTDDNGKPYRELTINALDWLNEHHFDYRIDPTTGETLIGKGLALEAPNDMYKTE